MKKSCGNCVHISSCQEICDNEYSSWELGEITTLNEYQYATARTDSHTSHKEAVLNFALGIAGEAGEIVDLVKKRMFHGHPMDMEKLKGELGDQLWYIARMAARFDLTLEKVAQANIDKLMTRYPEGFSQEKSINRVDTK